MTRLITLGELDRTWQGRWNIGQAMVLPVPTIHIHHTVTEQTDDPAADARTVHDIDQGRFGKISYSWLVHESSGSWIEGETVHRGAHTINNANQSLNGISFGIGVIGNFHPAAPIPPPREATDALCELIAVGIREFIVGPGLVSAGFVIDGHRDVYATACCGDNLYDRLPVIRALVSSPTPPTPTENDMTPYACKTSDGAYRTFAPKKDGTIWETTYGTKWEGPVQVMNGADAAECSGGIGGSCEGLRVDLYVIGKNGVQYHGYRVEPTQPWKWEDLRGDYS